MDEAAIYSSDSLDEPAPVRELTRAQRRVLGVLIEKGLTTPDSYPLTLKAVTAGCNQKSNRDPVTNYSEDAVEETLDELRQLGLVAVVHTESGRTERYRHFARKRYPFTEPQLAIITELLLRGRQQLGELRARASRMTPIDSQEELRESLKQLQADDYVRASGPLERRGIEVDHTFYGANEATDFAAVARDEERASDAAAPTGAIASASGRGLPDEVAELREEVEQLRAQLTELSDEITQLKQNLGV
jgi:uncharacterized protein